MKRFRVKCKYIKFWVCKGNVCSPVARVRVNSGAHRKAKILYAWPLMGYSVCYKLFMCASKCRCKQSRPYSGSRTYDVFRLGDKLLNEKRLLCKLYLYGVSRDALLAAATNKALASTWFDEMDSRTSDFESLAVLREDGMQLEFMDRQTIPMCLEAVVQNPESLQFVKNQTVEVCVEATRYCRDAAKYIRDPEMRMRVLYMLSNADKQIEV